MKLIPLVSIGVKRDGKTMYPTIGQVFDFNADEIKDLDKLSAETKIDYYRKPINEAPESEVVQEAPVVAASTGRKSAKKAASDEPKTPDADPAANTSGNEPEL